jgi:CRP-like cAMP-binding protein
MQKRTPFLDRLSAETVADIERRSVRREWPRHTSIYRAGEPCKGLHIIVDGLVKLYRAAPDGRQQIILLEGNGSVLALTPVLDEGDQVVSADTLKPTVTLFLARDDVLQMQAEYADFRNAVILEMARRFRATVALLTTIALKPVPARVATRVLELASGNDALDGSKTFKLLLSQDEQDELAHALGTSRESIARALAEMRAAGIIEQNRSSIRVVDANALFDWSRQGGTDSATPLPANI